MKEKKYIGSLDKKEKVPHGQGIQEFENGMKYIGQFKKGKRIGKGTYQKNNGDAIIGKFEHNFICGIGIIKYIDGSRYNGELVCGKPHGLGCHTDHRGNVREGFWERGQYAI